MPAAMQASCPRLFGTLWLAAAQEQARWRGSGSSRSIARPDNMDAFQMRPDERAGQGEPGMERREAGAPEQCTFLICARARRCQQPSNCLAGVIPVNPKYQPLYRTARERDE